MNMTNPIKMIVLSSAILFTSLAQANVKPIDDRENRAIARQTIDAPADKVWSEIGRVDGVENFIPTVFKSTSVEGKGKGAERVCVHHDGRELVEKIVAFDEVSMTLTYTLVRGGEQYPIENIYNTVQVHPISETQSLLVWESKYDDKEWAENPKMMEEFTQGGLAMVTAGAKRYIESIE